MRKWFFDRFYGTKLAKWICENIYIGHSPIYYNPNSLEPDYSCIHCGYKDNHK